MDKDMIEFFIEVLEQLTPDMPNKPKTDLLVAIDMLKNFKDSLEYLLKVQDQLEYVSNLPNLDSYSRNEIMNVLSELEFLIENY